MSILVMSLVWERAHDLDGNDLVVLLALADWGRDDGISWHSVAKLAQKAHVSERTVQRSLATLVDMGYLSVVRGGEDGKSTNVYRVHVAHLMGGDNLTPLPGRGDNVDTPGVTNLVGRGDNVDTRYVIDTKDKRNTPSPDAGVRESMREGAGASGGDTRLTTVSNNATVSTIAHFLFFDKEPTNKQRAETRAPGRVEVTKTGYDWAVGRGWRGPHSWLQQAVEGCLDFHRSNGKRLLDWTATVHYWINGEIKRGHDLPPAHMRDDTRRGKDNDAGTGQREKQYGYGPTGQPTNRATQFVNTAERLAERQRARRMVGDAGTEASTIGGDNGSGD